MSEHNRPSAAADEFHPAYFQVEFITDTSKSLPENFVIITGYATTGESWTEEKNKQADQALFDHLLSLGCSPLRVTGFSSESGHSEPGWAVDLDWEVACDIGKEFKQDAIFIVEGEELYLRKCGSEGNPVPAGKFKVHGNNPQN